MKITKRQLRRIIKEEKRKILKERHPDVQEGISRGFHEGIWNWIEEEAAASSLDLSDSIAAESIADALDSIAQTLRDNAAGRNPGGSIG